VQFGGIIEQDPTLIGRYSTISCENKQLKPSQYLLWTSCRCYICKGKDVYMRSLSIIFIQLKKIEVLVSYI
jgi:hypothetical protein